MHQTEENAMSSKSYDYFVGLDVSQRMTSICVIDTDGKKFCEGKCNTRPEDIRGWLTNRVDADKAMKIGLEAGNMSSWLYSGLVKSGFDVVCMETFQAHRFLATYRNKTDKTMPVVWHSSSGWVVKTSSEWSASGLRHRRRPGYFWRCGITWSARRSALKIISPAFSSHSA
ncbi:IS110 family transposase [Ochrobactrum haematophilum]|uniref:IS110 family transposase n=1 Tax=Brucella haematophila TaxID=419474 RepID=A0ABX1DR42_9HYPH|nr:IS110 family transposase [Brucella haematophila]